MIDVNGCRLQSNFASDLHQLTSNIAFDGRLHLQKKHQVISKVALLQYYAKSIHHDAEQWHEWTVDKSTAHTQGPIKRDIRSCFSLGMLQFTHSYWEKVQLLKSLFRTYHRESQPI